MKIKSYLLVVLGTGLAILWPLALLHAQSNVTLTTTASFTSVNGIHPSAPLVVGNDGNFYGTTEYGGGAGGGGTVFKMTPDGALTSLATFRSPNGAYSTAGLIQAADGNFYGTTSEGGSGGFGTIFRITPTGNLTTLFSFNNANGANPYGGLVADAAGNLYGTAAYGGPYFDQDPNGLGYGTIFKITTNGDFTTLYSFTGMNDGFYPLTGLTQGADGNYYGTTAEVDTFGDPAFGAGTIFQITPDGTFTNLVTLNYTNGANPYAGLTLGGDGNFYGTTYVGGDANAGTVFKMTPAGALTTLVSFENTNGANPYGTLVAAPDGSFIGTTELGGANDYGTVFQITPSGTLKSLVSFNYFSNGADPTAGLTLAADGTFYGTTYTGGTPGGGTVFHLVVPSAPAPPVFKSVARSGSMLTFSWSTTPGHSYQVLYKTGFGDANWHSLGGPIVAGSNSCSASDSIGPDPQRFYRVVTSP